MALPLPPPSLGSLCLLFGQSQREFPSWTIPHISPEPQKAPGQGEISTYMMDILSPSSPAEGEERSAQDVVGWELSSTLGLSTCRLSLPCQVRGLPSPHSPQAPLSLSTGCSLALSPLSSCIPNSRTCCSGPTHRWGQSRAKQMGLSPGGLQGSSVRGEKVHQDPRELLEPEEGNRNLPWHTPHP